MSAALPPMHAALSVLGTMAGQYLAAQSAQAQSAQPQPQPQPQPPQPQPVFNAPPTRQPTTNGVNLCDFCHAKPKYFDGTKTHSYCGKTCAAKIQNKGASGSNPPARGKSGKAPARAKANMCDYCHKQPKYNDGKTTHSFCGKSCAQKAKAAGVVSGGAPLAPSKPLKNGCLLCGKAVKKGNFCGQACTSKVEKSAPLLIEVPNAHDTFKSVADQFKVTWRHATPCPTVTRVYKVIGHPTSISKYEAYRTSVESRGKFAAAGRSSGNENRRWHGTTRECLLGDGGNTALCSSTSCSLCGIIRTSYSLNLFGKKTGWGRFGAGIYTSSTSSKSNDYSNNVKPSKQKAILLNKVVVGKGYKMTQDNTRLTAPPPGYDSVLAEVSLGGSLNYDELVCYSENAIRPSYLLIYDA
ncbi:ADP-ribosylation [Boletus edulis BED1]|uniref:ADP-ribosylation n=1 Tax=Boletus edulis BED1 TaxID=1328754 RepID=A0AAD4BG55_BOLED|nr:ADP-ribosylation [Boletus edulis BED1]